MRVYLLLTVIASLFLISPAGADTFGFDDEPKAKSVKPKPARSAQSGVAARSAADLGKAFAWFEERSASEIQGLIQKANTIDGRLGEAKQRLELMDEIKAMEAKHYEQLDAMARDALDLAARNASSPQTPRSQEEARELARHSEMFKHARGRLKEIYSRLRKKATK